jgi:hypothetical protein
VINFNRLIDTMATSTFLQMARDFQTSFLLLLGVNGAIKKMTEGLGVIASD